MTTIKSEKGATLIEFVLVLPLLLLLTFAIIEFGILLFDKAVVTNASREGARAGIVYRTLDSVYTPLAESEIITIVNNYLGDHLINLGDPDNGLGVVDANWIRETDPVTGEAVDYLVVDVPFTYDFMVVPALARLVSGVDSMGTVPFAGTTRMRMELQDSTYVYP